MLLFTRHAEKYLTLTYVHYIVRKCNRQTIKLAIVNIFITVIDHVTCNGSLKGMHPRSIT